MSDRAAVDASSGLLESIELVIENMATARRRLEACRRDPRRATTRELASMTRTFDSHLERRQKLGLRTSNVGDEPRPSPLKFLSFWRVILDEVQKAPAGRKAGNQKVAFHLDA